MNISAHDDVLPWIEGDATDAVLIVEHPDNDALVADSQGFHFLDPETGKVRRMRGLTTPLAEVFWPGRALPGGRSSSSSSLGKSRSALRTPQAAPGARHGAIVQQAARGILRGNIVHQQIEDLVALDSERFLRKYRNGAHKWSHDALQAILERGVRPLACELGVVALDLGIATKIDMVAVKRSGRLVFIEFKTGYDAPRAWRGHTQEMQKCLRGVLNDTAQNRAIVQVIAGALMAKRSRALQGDFECWVVHISSAGTTFDVVHGDFVLQHGPRIYAALAAHQEARNRLKRMERARNLADARRRRPLSLY